MLKFTWSVIVLNVSTSPVEAAMHTNSTSGTCCILMKLVSLGTSPESIMETTGWMVFWQRSQANQDIANKNTKLVDYCNVCTISSVLEKLNRPFLSIIQTLPVSASTEKSSGYSRNVHGGRAKVFTISKFFISSFGYDPASLSRQPFVTVENELRNSMSR